MCCKCAHKKKVLSLFKVKQIREGQNIGKQSNAFPAIQTYFIHSLYSTSISIIDRPINRLSKFYFCQLSESALKKKKNPDWSTRLKIHDFAFFWGGLNHNRMRSNYFLLVSVTFRALLFLSVVMIPLSSGYPPPPRTSQHRFRHSEEKQTAFRKVVFLFGVFFLSKWSHASQGITPFWFIASLTFTSAHKIAGHARQRKGEERRTALIPPHALSSHSMV